MSFEGMDVGQAQRLAQRLDANARALAQIAADLTGLTAELGRTWLGPASATFQQQWTTQHRAALNSAAQALTEMHTRVMANIQQQIRASTAESWSTAGEPHSAHHGLLSDFERYAADAGRLYWRVGKDVFYQPFPSLANDVTKGPWTLAKWSRFCEDASGALYVASLVFAFVPVVGEVLDAGDIEFGMAATVTEASAVAEHEQGASVTNVAFDEMASLPGGHETAVIAKILWQSGIRHSLGLPGPDPDAPRS